MALPSINVLASMPAREKLDVLDLLFEPSATLHALSLESMNSPFENYAALIARVRVQLMRLAESDALDDLARLDEILGAHPRLGQKGVDSAQSRAEQSSLAQSEKQSGSGGDSDEAAKLAVLNELYETKYPTLRYVVFVNGRPRDVIMQDMRERIANSSLERERGLAIQAMCDIANDRVGKLLPVA